MRRAAWLVLGVLVSGCFRTVVRTGQPPDRVPDGYDEKWHSGWIAGLVEASGPHELDRLCREGTAEVRTSTDPLQSLLTYVTTTIYSPQSVTVVCAPPGAPPAPSPSGPGSSPLSSSTAYPPSASGFPPPPPPPDY
ncbi:MAG: hypothetical protein U0263_33785 [Polyangiaceae bacterium]